MPFEGMEMSASRFFWKASFAPRRLSESRLLPVISRRVSIRFHEIDICVGAGALYDNVGGMVDGDGARSVADFVGICGGDGEGFVGADVKIAGSVTVDVLIRPCRFADHAEQETALLRLNVYGSVLGYIKGVASGHKAFDRSVVYFNNHALGIIDDDIHR